MPRRSAFKTAANTTTDKLLKEFPALQLDVKKKATMLANRGAEGTRDPFRSLPGVLALKSALRLNLGVPGYWPPPPMPLPAAS